MVLCPALVYIDKLVPIHPSITKRMNPIEELATILEHQDVTQTQREALIDLIVWAMYVDGRIDYEENEQIDEVIDQLSTATLPIRSYLYTAIAKIRDAWNDPDRAERILSDIDTRLGTDAIRRIAYALCESVTRADDQLIGPELAFLERVRHQFGL